MGSEPTKTRFAVSCPKLKCALVRICVGDDFWQHMFTKLEARLTMFKMHVTWISLGETATYPSVLYHLYLEGSGEVCFFFSTFRIRHYRWALVTTTRKAGRWQTFAFLSIKTHLFVSTSKGVALRKPANRFWGLVFPGGYDLVMRPSRKVGRWVSPVAVSALQEQTSVVPPHPPPPHRGALPVVRIPWGLCLPPDHHACGVCTGQTSLLLKHRSWRFLPHPCGSCVETTGLNTMGIYSLTEAPGLGSSRAEEWQPLIDIEDPGCCQLCSASLAGSCVPMLLLRVCAQLLQLSRRQQPLEKKALCFPASL